MTSFLARRPRARAFVACSGILAVAILVLALTATSGARPQNRPSAPAKPAQDPGAAAELAFRRAAAQAIAHGKRAEAETLARVRGSADQAAAAVLAALAASRGDYDEAAALVVTGGSGECDRRRSARAGLLLQQRGRKADARRVLLPVAAAGNRARTAAELARAARAARALGRPHDASSLFADAAAAAPRIRPFRRRGASCSSRGSTAAKR